MTLQKHHCNQFQIQFIIFAIPQFDDASISTSAVVPFFLNMYTKI